MAAIRNYFKRNENMKIDKENQLAAVKENGMLLKNCGGTRDYDVRLAAIKQNGMAIQFIKKSSQTSAEKIEALNSGEDVMRFLSKPLSQEEQIAAVRNRPRYYQDIVLPTKETRREVMLEDVYAATHYLGELSVSENVVYLICSTLQHGDESLSTPCLSQLLMKSEVDFVEKTFNDARSMGKKKEEIVDFVMLALSKHKESVRSGRANTLKT
jgi:hypothetical protein